MSLPQSPESQREPTVHFGMRFDELTDDIWRGIIATYFEIARDEIIEPWKLEQYAASDVDSEFPGDFRFGSLLNRDSKLYVFHEGDGLISFSFYPNHQREADENPDSPRYREGRSIDEAFRTRVDQLLLATGLAEPLPA